MTEGERWIRLLRLYSPVPEGDAQEAEHVNDLAHRLGLPPLSFSHPAWADIVECFPKDTGNFKTIVLTGTAGDGKTSLCRQLVNHLTDTSVEIDSSAKLQTFEIPTGAGTRKVTLIYDVTDWRKACPEDVVSVLEQAAAHCHGTGGHAFVLAVNDGQLHETIRALPATCSEELKTMGRELIAVHASGLRDSTTLPLLRLINLCRFPSDLLMELCLDGIFSRSEWKCLQEEKNTPLFGTKSPIPANYALLTNPAVRQRLLTFARIADATGHHLPIRAILILLTNALLGHPKAPNGVIRPGLANNNLLAQHSTQIAALHLNLFGYNLSPSERGRREAYRFLSMLHAGEETTNGLDELIVFGDRDDELKQEHAEFVALDPLKQRNPAFGEMLVKYIRGEINEEKETAAFLAEVAHERRRLLLHATSEQVKNYNLWSTTVFHHAGEFVEHFLDPIRLGKAPSIHHIRKLAAGLNRVWTGLLLDENTHQIFITTGLDLSTSAVSDLLLKEIDITDVPPGFSVEPNGIVPKAVIRCAEKTFSFELTLPRFEFLMRVAGGAMPSCFSRESYEDFLSLKQCCLRDLQIRPNPLVLQRLDVLGSGQIHKEPIHLAE